MNNQVDFELDKYVKEVFYEIESLTYAEEGAIKEDKFTEYFIDKLSDAGELESTKLCTYIKPNKNGNIDYKINAYGLRLAKSASNKDIIETVDFIISHYESTNEMYRVYKSDFDAQINYLKKITNICLKGYLDDIDESHEAHTLGTLISKNSKHIDRINFYILSNGIMPHDPPKNLKLKGFEDVPIIIHVWDVERFHRLNQSKDNREPIEIRFDEIGSEGIPCLKMPVNNNIYDCYLAIVPGKVLSILYRNYSTRLLESNVRAFLQQTGKVNKGIRDTIKTKPQMFLPYNNGLAVTGADVVTQRDDNNDLRILSIKDFQIVNGGQTTASLFHTEKKHKTDLSDVYVQMKLTVIRDETTKNEEVPNISRYANSQNKVSELDLSSNHKFLIRLEELSRTTYAIDPLDHNKQTIWYFERVNGQYRESLSKEPTPSRKRAFQFKYPKSQKFVKSEIAKYLNIWKQLPHIVSRGAQKNYVKFMIGIEKEFKKTLPGRVYYEDLVASAILFKNADKIFGRKNQNPIGENTNIRSYTINYGLSLLHLLTDNKINLGKIWTEQQIDDSLKAEIRNILIHTYKYLTSDPNQLISEMAKQEATWEDFKTHRYELNKENIKPYILSQKKFQERYSSDSDDIEVIEKTHRLQEINKLGIVFWDGLFYWLTHNPSILSSYQNNIADKIKFKLKKNGNLNDTEIKNGIDIIQRLEENGVNLEKIKQYAKVEVKEIINVTTLWNRLMKLSRNDWKRAIDLGQQTNTLNSKQIMVLKAMMQQIKTKQCPDLKRLEITKQSLDKLKKFGIKY